MKEIKDDIKQTERYSMFLGWNNQYCENDYTTKCSLQIQCDPYQITKTFFTELEQKISQFIWKHKRPRRMELKESSFLTSVILQSYSHQDSMVMEQKQKIGRAHV